MPLTKEIARDGLRLRFSETVDCRWARHDLRPGWSGSMFTFKRFAAALEQLKFRRRAVAGIWPSTDFATPAQLAMVGVRAEMPRGGAMLVATAPGGYIGIVASRDGSSFWLDDLQPSLALFDFGRGGDRGRAPGGGPILLLHVFASTEHVVARRTLDEVMDLVRPDPPERADAFEVESLDGADLPPFYSGSIRTDGLSQLEFEREIELDMEEDGSPPESDRFLQAQSLVRVGEDYEPAQQGFFAGGQARVRGRIGEPTLDWEAELGPFPVHLLPVDQASWDLVVWLTEPQHFSEQTLRKTIRLPNRGDSTVAEFDFVVGDSPRFEGRITVLHNGRVLQTAMLRATVTQPGMRVRRAGMPTLEDEIRVFARMEDRRKFDLAIVQNHDSAGAAATTVLSDERAWVADTQLGMDAARAINLLLSRVADWESDFRDGLRTKDGIDLLVEMAQEGSMLGTHLMGTLARPTNRQDIVANEFIQVVNTRTDSVIPFEFVYDYEKPEPSANLCEHWEAALQQGSCPNPCNEASRDHVCPMGFWGLRKVIERHALSPELAREGYPVFLQSESGRDRRTLYLGGTVLVAGSNRIKKEMPGLVAHLQIACGVDVQHATDWKEWETMVGGHRPNLLVALPHTDGAVTRTTLELGEEPRKVTMVRRQHVCASDHVPGPVVALLGCDTLTTADEFSYQVMVFRDNGAAIVIGTIATVFGKHAVAVAQTLVTRLLAGGDEPQCLGEIMRAVKRDGLRANLLMPLCLVAFGDADWKLSPKGNADV